MDANESRIQNMIRAARTLPALVEAGEALYKALAYEGGASPSLTEFFFATCASFASQRRALLEE